MTLITSIWKHPANQDARFLAVMRAISWQISKRVTGRPRDIGYHGLKLRCYPTSHSASRAIYFSGLPDFREMRFMLDYLKPGDHFIDAGANVGLYTLLAISAVGPSGYVHAFEPNHEPAQSLLESIHLNGITNVSVHHVGLADKVGYADFVATTDDCTGHIPGASHVSSTARIPIGRLDQVLEDVPYAMAKFDIEGYEPIAIRGASDWLKRGNPPVMLIEMAGYSKRHGITTADFITELDRFGYFTAVYCPETRELHKTNRPWDIPVENVLAISKEREEFVTSRLRANHRPCQSAVVPIAPG